MRPKYLSNPCTPRNLSDGDKNDVIKAVIIGGAIALATSLSGVVADEAKWLIAKLKGDKQ